MPAQDGPEDRLSISPAEPADLAPLRPAYLASLAEPQEFHCERASQSRLPFLVREAGNTSGYFIVDRRGVLIEFHATAPDNVQLFDRVVDMAGLRRAVCKTFDAYLYAACSRRAKTRTRKGLLYRRLVDVEEIVPDPAMRSRVAYGSDVPAVMAIDDGFFDDESEIRSYVEAGQMLVFETDNGLAGCGLLQEVVAGSNAFDLGMMVAPSCRRRGVGRHIVRHLAMLCLSTGKRPICGCSIDNHASRQCLESAGFRSDHQLLEFAW